MNTDKIAVIIIDDDFASKNTIKNYLRISQNYFLADDFSGAVSALDWLKSNSADIAICDMNMPNIDGIELITQASRLCPELHFLAVSAYSDFRYLRECMIHSVEDYLLKHELTAEILINSLDKIKEKYNMKPALNHLANALNIIEHESQFTVNSINNLIKSGAINFRADAVIPVIISPDYNNELFPAYTHFSDQVIFAIKDIICSILDNRYSYLLHMNVSFQFALLLAFNDHNTTFQDKAKSLLFSIKDKVLRLLNVSLTVGYSAKNVRLDAAMKLLTVLKSFRENKLYMPPGGLFILGELTNSFSDNYTLASYLKEQIKTLIELKDFPALKVLVHTIFMELAKRYISRYKVIEICELLMILIKDETVQDLKGRSWETLRFHDFEFIQQYENAIVNIIDKVIRNITEKANPVYSTPVARAISYLEDNHKEKISLESCADMVGISYTHLSRIFKKETSLSFSEYLNRFRIAKAKMLLVEKKMAIKQIVDETGFSNYNYFFRVFKEIEGITPIEYVDNANN